MCYCLCKAGFNLRQAQAQEKTENNEERQGKRMDNKEEGTDEEKRKCCSTRHKVHSSET